ncbi:MAG TPA: Calx-beta domain-containing protein [Verrucomicrobiae bacterium]|nr:Calx-beta domain-containing protein [Verrucomicrobiae bacterium]
MADYNGIGDRATIPAGSSQLIVTVTSIDDPFREEPNETVTLNLLPASTYNVGDPAGATITIGDNDNGQPAVGFTLLSSSVPESVGTATVAVAVSADPAEGSDVTVDYKFAVGTTALPGIDFPLNATTGRLVFTHNTNPPDSAYAGRIQLISIPIIDNTNAQPNRTIFLTLLEPAPNLSNDIVTNIMDDPMNPGTQTTNVVTNLVITPVPMNAYFDTFKTHTLTLLDDDASVVNVEATDPVAMEAGAKTGLFTIRRSNTNGNQTVYFAFSGTATPGRDYQTVDSPIVIPAGQDSVAIPIIPVDDPIQEYMEDVHISLLRAPGAQLGSTDAAVNIIDNDGTIEFTATAYSVTEGVGVAQIPVRRTSDTNSTVLVQYVLSAGSATPGADFALTNGIIAFGPGEILKNVPVTIVDDSQVEPPETINLLLRNAGDGSSLGGQSTATLSILDNDTAAEFAQPTFRAYENSTNAIITVHRVGVATNSFSIDYLVLASTGTNLNATPNVDFVATNGTLNFGPGQTEVTFPVRILDDTLFEGDERVSLVLTNASATGSIGQQSAAELVIVDDECYLEFSSLTNGAPEYSGAAQIVIRRVGGTVNPVNVSFSTAPGTAKPNKDYVAISGTISFAGDSYVLPPDGSGVPQFQPGETNKTVTVRVLDNVTGEGDRQFTASVATPRGPLNALPGSVTLGSQTNTIVTILDDEAPGYVDFQYNPGQGTDQNVLSVAVQPDGKTLLGGAFTKVDGIVFNHIARLHDDGYLDSFLNPGGGADQNVLAVAAQADNRALVGGDFTAISGVTRTRIARLKGDGTVDDTFVPGGGANSLVRAIAVQPNGAILIGGDFTQIDGVPRAGVARLAADGSLDTSFNPLAGATSGSVYTLAVQPDGHILVGGSFAAFGSTGRSFLARLNNDGSPDVSFQLTGSPDHAVRALAVQADGRIIAGGEFTTMGGAARAGVARLNADGSLDSAFDPGAGNIVYAVGVVPDGKVMVGGAFTNFNGLAINRLARLNPDGSVDDGFAIGSGANGTIRTLAVQPDGAVVIGGDFTTVRDLPRAHIARVHGDDKFSANKIQFSATDYQIPEDAGQAVITVKRSGDTTTAVSVDYATADGTAVAGVNYTPAQGTLQFALGETVKTFSVTVLDDHVARGDTTVKLQLVNVPSGYSTTAQLTATLAIQGTEGAISFSSSSYSVGEADGAATIAVRLSRANPGVVTVDYTTLDDTAVAGLDYIAASGTLTFNPGVTNQTFGVPIVNESQPRNDRSLRLQLSNPHGGSVLGNPSTASLIINDDDRGPSFHVDIASANGGSVSPGSGTFPAGSVKSFTATPANGFQFVSWQGTTNSTQNPLTLVVNRDYSLTPLFRPSSFTYDFAPPFTQASLSTPPWSGSGNAAWQILAPTNGTDSYAAQSGPIGDNQQSILELTITTAAGTGSFDVRVSSEEAWDFLEFSVNGGVIQRWSGEVPWQSFLFPLPAGQNRLMWRYSKDPNFSSGLDAAFISNLYLPLNSSGGNSTAATLQVFASPGTATRIQIQGVPGYTYLLQASTDLIHWQTISTNNLSTTSIVVTDPDSPQHSTRFYRAVLQ